MKAWYLLILTLSLPVIIFIFTLGKYYGFYYDNHHFNLLALDLLEKFRPYLYTGTNYTIHSTFYAYLLYPVFKIFGPTDFSVELVSAIFHLLTIVVCFRLGKRLFNQDLGLIFAFLVAISPLYLVNIYTWSENSFIFFLNALSIYYFLSGFQETSAQKLILSALLYSLSCFQSIYSIPLLLFFISFILLQTAAYIKSRKQINFVSGHPKMYKFLRGIFYIAASIAFLYLALLIDAIFIKKYRIAYYISFAALLFIVTLGFKKTPKPAKEILKFCFLFIFIVAAAILLLDFLVQLDSALFGTFGYYKDTRVAGGYGMERPPLFFCGREIKIFNIPVKLSILTSLLPENFRYCYTGISFNLSRSFKILVAYYQKCFPLPINIFLVLGLIGLLIDIFHKKYNKEPLSMRHTFSLVWILAINTSFINQTSPNMMRTHILPMPYFFASLGVYYSAYLAGNIFRSLSIARVGNLRTVTILAAVILAVFINLEQFRFLLNNVFYKYRYDKAHYNYYNLFHGWPYGRGYKEVGEFLLKDAPLKQNGEFRSIFIHTISPYVPIGRCLIFFDSIDWYTQNKIRIVYDDIDTSYRKYGRKVLLARYLEQLFYESPDIEAIYFSDFFDTKGDYSFFSKIHRDIMPYRIINDDDSLEYDCILYKFERDKWREQLH